MNTATQNIYTATTLAPHDAQLLLTLALFCLVLGILLAEKRALMALGGALSLFSKSRSVAEPSA